MLLESSPFQGPQGLCLNVVAKVATRAEASHAPQPQVKKEAALRREAGPGDLSLGDFNWGAGVLLVGETDFHSWRY